jgi:hypothetical protein
MVSDGRIRTPSSLRPLQVLRRGATIGVEMASGETVAILGPIAMMPSSRDPTATISLFGMEPGAAVRAGAFCKGVFLTYLSARGLNHDGRVVIPESARGEDPLRLKRHDRDRRSPGAQAFGGKRSESDSPSRSSPTPNS